MHEQLPIVNSVAWREIHPAMLRFALRSVLTYPRTFRAVLGQSLACRAALTPCHAVFTGGSSPHEEIVKWLFGLRRFL